MRQDRRVDSSTPKNAQPDARISRANVSSSFDEHAATYDRLVGANPGYHEHLRMSARRMGIPNRGAGMRLLDLGCGTGASTAGAARRRPGRRDHRRRRVEGDAGPGARAKTWPPTVRFVHADAEDLAAAGITGEYDGILAAYLLRNLAEPRRRPARVPRPAAPRRPAGPARVLGEGLRAQPRGLDGRLLGGDHPDGPAARRLRRAVPLPVAQRAGLRRRPRADRAAARAPASRT